MVKKIDTILIGMLLGYTKAQAKSIVEVKIFGDKRVEVTRFVQDPDSDSPKKLHPPAGNGPDWDTRRSRGAIRFVELISWEAASMSRTEIDFLGNFRSMNPDGLEEAEYVKLSKPVVKALKRAQWGIE